MTTARPESVGPAGGEEFEPLLLLASASAGRHELLSRAGIAFSARPVDLDEGAVLARAVEAADGDLPAAEQVLVLARAKAEAGLDASDGGYVVLGCDSMLEFDGEVMGKPLEAGRAVERWRQVRGKSAVLHTGHWIVDDRDPADGGTGATIGTTVSTEVSFADLSDEEIDAYVATGEPLGVAGGFTIDGRGSAFIDSITGDHTAVIGLSIPALRGLLAELDLLVSDLWTDAEGC